MFVYHPGKLQVIPDALSRMPGAHEEGDPADTEKFLAVDRESVDNLEEGGGRY